MKLYLILAMILIISVTAFAQENLSIFDQGFQEIGTTQENAIDNDIGIPAESEESSNYNTCLNGCSSCETRCKDSALQQYAENNKQVSICDSISNEALKISCQDNINSALALASGDSSKCSAITDEDLTKNCELLIVQNKAVNSGNTEICSSLDEQSKNGCINNVNFALAIKNGDDSFCNKLPPSQQTYCIEQLSMNPQTDLGINPAENKKSLSPKINWLLIGGIAGGILIFSLLSFGAYYLIKNRAKPNEAPLMFQQQTQPSQLAKMVPLQQAEQSSKNIDINKLPNALKKVGP